MSTENMAETCMTESELDVQLALKEKRREERRVMRDQKRENMLELRGKAVANKDALDAVDSEIYALCMAVTEDVMQKRPRKKEDPLYVKFVEMLKQNNCVVSIFDMFNAYRVGVKEGEALARKALSRLSSRPWISLDGEQENWVLWGEGGDTPPAGYLGPDGQKFTSIN